MKNLDGDTLLRRPDLVEALAERGFPITVKTLETMATRGGGPQYQTFGRAVLYRWSDALAWAEGRLSSPRRSSSEGDFPHTEHATQGSGVR